MTKKGGSISCYPLRHVGRMKQKDKIHEFYFCSTLVNQFMINNCISIKYFQLIRISNRDMDCTCSMTGFLIKT